MARVRRQLVKTPLGYVTYIWLAGGVVPYEVLMAELDECGISSLGKTAPRSEHGYRPRFQCNVDRVEAQS